MGYYFPSAEWECYIRDPKYSTFFEFSHFYKVFKKIFEKIFFTYEKIFLSIKFRSLYPNITPHGVFIFRQTSNLLYTRAYYFRVIYGRKAGAYFYCSIAFSNNPLVLITKQIGSSSDPFPINAYNTKGVSKSSLGGISQYFSTTLSKSLLLIIFYALFPILLVFL